MPFPITRMRRLRATESLRRLVQETRLSLDQIIMPLFVCPGSGVKKEIEAMPDNYQMSIDILIDECKELRDSGIPAILLFGLPETKDETGSDAMSETGIIQKAVRAVKKEAPDILLITDLCFCEYTSHGHCGVIIKNAVDNDRTLENLAKAALAQAKAGADIIAPSDMMDGRVGAIRNVLDHNGFSEIPIMSYAAKYASGFYGPFREAAQSAPQFGDRKSYQMDPPNALEALREVELDIEEGADIVMVKPALAYLDIIYRVKQKFSVPVAAYNVSGEYSMIRAAGRLGWIDENRIMLETLTAIKRAGADIILTYFAKKLAKILK